MFAPPPDAGDQPADSPPPHPRPPAKASPAEHPWRPRPIAARPDTVMDVLKTGSASARAVAQATMHEVRQAMKIEY